jgi:hypothetical protein
MAAAVISKWGRTVFIFDDINQSWDGKDQIGSALQVFIFTPIKQKQRTEHEGQGNIHLTRK